jgi:ubiquinone/menaquinone biosynthesis C-methylase UbiE
MHERRFRPEQAHRLDDPERRTWLPPAEVLGRLGLAPGMVIADVGAGVGYFTLPLARAVAPGGRVFAVDVEPALLDRLRAKLAAPEAPAGVTVVEGDATATRLAAASCDRVLFANVWHELDDHRAALRETARVLRAGGAMAILDWRPDATRPPGPPIAHRQAASAVAERLGDAGWHVDASGPLGRHSYLLVARPLGAGAGR